MSRGIIGYVKGLFDRRASTAAEDRASVWTVDIDSGKVTCSGPGGRGGTVLRNEVSMVACVVRKHSLHGAHLWWLVYGAAKRLIFAFPHGSAGEEDVLAFLIDREGFDHQALAGAMSHGGDGEVILWERPDNLPAAP